MDGADAIAVTAREGFEPHSVVFLDIERMEKMPDAMRAYYRAWARTLLADGRYLPGVYVHAHNAQVVHDDLKAEFAAAGVTEEPRVWVATGTRLRRGEGAAGRRVRLCGRLAGDDRRGTRGGEHQAAGGCQRLHLDVALRPRQARRLTHS